MPKGKHIDAQTSTCQRTRDADSPGISHSLIGCLADRDQRVRTMEIKA
jgi:hypothetical protein